MSPFYTVNSELVTFKAAKAKEKEQVYASQIVRLLLVAALVAAVPCSTQLDLELPQFMVLVTVNLDCQSFWSWVQ